MANNNNEGVDNTPDNSTDAGSEKSFVGKFMSGIIKSTPLSKWFGKDSASRSVIRRRDEDEEIDTSFSFQPPSKRAKLPTDVERNNYSAHIFESPVTVHTSNNVNNISSKVLGKFPEPVPGPSGIKSRNLFKKHSTSSTNTVCTESFENEFEIVNGDHDSDSGESTSGYSSAPKLVDKQKREEGEHSNEPCDRVTPKNRSLFTSLNDSSGRTLFPDRSPQMNTSLSSRRPTFDASTFGSPNFVDRTLSTKRIMNSPFYSGRTVYGGASAYGRQLGRNSEQPNAVSRTFVQIKPMNEKSTSDNTTLSKTARRILSTLEQYSTPISDAKKIPVSPRKPGLLSTYVGATPYLVRDRKKPLNKELQVPTVPDLLQMKQKERLQTSTETVRQIATKSKSSLNKEEYKLRSEEDPKQKHSNKMKSSVASVRQKTQPIEPVVDVNLPKVSLPITTLPKFDFVLMPPTNSTETKKDAVGKNVSSNVIKSSVSTINKPTVIEKKETETKVIEITKISDYTFAEPVVILKDVKSVTPINCFKFSKPLSQKDADLGLNFKSSENNFNTGFKVKNNGENANATGTVKPTNQLLTGSVMDVLGKKKDSLSSQNTLTAKVSWECPTCWVRNDADKTKCCACDEPKPQTLEKPASKGFGDKFKLSSDKWECSSCMVRNNNSDPKCVACGTARANGEKQTVKSGFGDQFKPPASTWECTSCLIRNKDELANCAACGTAKVVKPSAASNFGDKFKPSGDTWECSTCMIRNKNDVDKCVACETTRPGAKTTPPQLGMSFNASGTTFSFGIKQEWECKTCMIKNKNDLKKCAACEMPRDGEDTVKKGFGDSFKMKAGEWECTSCMVKNKFTTNVCVCCGVTKPGSSSEKLAEISKNEEKKPVNSFNFGIDKTTVPQFTFGIPASSSVTKENTTVVSTAPTFSFGSTVKTSTTTSSSFTFGINTQEKTASTKTVTSTSESTTPNISSNPLLKPNEKLPEKASPAPVGFKFGLDNSLNKNQISDTSSTKPETPSTGTFSTSFVSSPVSTFQFKPATVNGDINKPKDGTFSTGATKPHVFGSEVNKPKETFGTDASKSKELPPFTNINKSNESPFSGSNRQADLPFNSTPKSVNSPFSKPTDSPFGTTSKPTDSPFGTTSKPTDSPFASSNKPIGSPFLSANKPTDSPFGGASKAADSPFGGTNKTTDSPFGGKPGESPFRNVSKPVELPFESAKSPFGKPNESVKSPFSMMSKPTESPFSNATEINKPKESPFGTPNHASKPQGVVFRNVNESNKPPESLFSSDGNKPKEILFGSKPTESSNLFGGPTSTSTFNFTPKPIESSAAFPAATTTQPASSGLFKFGADASHTSAKRTLGDSSDNISNGFGTAAKVPAFGASQSFGSTENKPFSFGNAEPTPKSSGFSFAQTDKSNAAGPVFNFGGSAPSAPSGGFNFSAPSSGFNFGGAPKVESQPFNVPNNNVFGSGASAAKNGSFNFGTNANNNNQKAVFSFGANQTSQPSQSSFPTQAQSGFNFGGAPAPSLNAPPTGTFNFTGTPSFTEGTSSQAQPRKFKKAIRRTTSR